ncbi:MAG: GNAT family N-acetyltransferase [Pelomonas sp.]|nr:GNAT family N-acetyltransferase [Roseateles sp.]
MSESELPSGYALRPLGPADLPGLMALHAAVMAALPDPAMFRLFGGAESFFSNHWGARGESLGVCAGERIVAYGSLTRPRAGDRDNYAGDIGWDAARAGRVALLSAAMVDPAERGQGLHATLIRARLQLAAARGVPELLVRAAPTNTLSRRTLLAHGFALVWLGVQAEGSLRHVLWRPVERTAAVADAATTWVAAEDLEAQTRLLASGWRGVAMREGDAAIGFAPTPFG